MQLNWGVFSFQTSEVVGDCWLLLISSVAMVFIWVGRILSTCVWTRSWELMWMLCFHWTVLINHGDYGISKPKMKFYTRKGTANQYMTLHSKLMDLCPWRGIIITYKNNKICFRLQLQYFTYPRRCLCRLQ